MGRSLKLLVGAAVIVGLLLGAAFGGVLSESPSAAPSSASVPGGGAGSLGTSLEGLTGRDTVTTVRRLEQSVALSPAPETLAQLGLAYQLRWRESGDPSFLPLSERALRQALELQRDDPAATLGLGSLALTRHRFRAALALGRKGHRLAPDAAAPYAVIGDALLELGRYREAFATFERMVATKPTLGGYARIAYARELSGDRRGAVAAMRLAFDSAGGVPEPAAWSLVEIAKLEFGSGRLDEAERALREALRVLPGYVYAREQLAQVLFARGRTAAAIREAKLAANAIPLPQFVSLLADLLDSVGAHAEAQKQRATVGAIHRLLSASGVRVDLEVAVYRADLGLRAAETVRLARDARADRPSVLGDDALGWALARAGRCEEAERWLDRALRLGTRDALLYFHRGYAAGCAGDPAAMRTWYGKALALNPSFSVRWAPVAARAIEALDP